MTEYYKNVNGNLIWTRFFKLYVWTAQLARAVEYTVCIDKTSPNKEYTGYVIKQSDGET